MSANAPGAAAGMGSWAGGGLSGLKPEELWGEGDGCNRQRSRTESG